MHTDYTIGVRVVAENYVEWEIDAAHTREEAQEAAVVHAVEEMAERMKQDPWAFADVKSVKEPEK